MKRREFITLIGGAAVAWPLGARGQEAGRTYRLGFLTQVGRNAPGIVAFFDELRAHGFVEGGNLSMIFPLNNGCILRRRLVLCEHLPGSVAVDAHRTVDDNTNTLVERRKAVVGQRPQMPTEPLLSSGPDNQSEQRLRTFV